VGKYILDQISAGYSTTAAIALGMQQFGIKERAAYYALRRARELQQSGWYQSLANLAGAGNVDSSAQNHAA